jgi:hypothetical protein
MFYTREQIQRLEKYRKTFETAVHSGFARNVGSVALKDIESIYDEAFGSHYSYNSGCSVCVLGFLKRVGEPFLKEAEAYKKKDEKQAQELALQENKQEDLQAEEEKTFPPDVEMKDGTITISFDRAEAEMEALKTNNTEPPKTNKRTRKKKVEENGTE